jgi:hypothetical protein
MLLCACKNGRNADYSDLEETEENYPLNVKKEACTISHYTQVAFKQEVD